jgi:hypothetical protein
MLLQNSSYYFPHLDHSICFQVLNKIFIEKSDINMEESDVVWSQVKHPNSRVLGCIFKHLSKRAAWTLGRELYFMLS